MRLSYSKGTGFVKLNGAIVGTVTGHGTGLLYRHFQFTPTPTVEAASLEELLPKVRELLIQGKDPK